MSATATTFQYDRHGHLLHEGGAVVQLDYAKRVAEKARWDPASLTAFDLEVHQSFFGPLPKALAVAPPPAPAAPALTDWQLKVLDVSGYADLAAPEDYDRADDEDSLKTLVTRWSKAGDRRPWLATPLSIFTTFVGFVYQMNERNKERNARLNAQEARLHVIDQQLLAQASENTKERDKDRIREQNIDSLFRSQRTESEIREEYSAKLEEEIREVRAAIRAELRREVRTEVEVQFGRELRELQTEIQTVKSRPDLVYRDVFRQGERYASGNIVTRSGSLWLALTSTTAQPGSDPSAWRLICKGRD
jgi:hypothetical protein